MIFEVLNVPGRGTLENRAVHLYGIGPGSYLNEVCYVTPTTTTTTTTTTGHPVDMHSDLGVLCTALALPLALFHHPSFPFRWELLTCAAKSKRAKPTPSSLLMK